VYLLYSVDDGLKFARGEFDGLAVVLPGREALEAIGIGVTGWVS